ncbi:MAG: sigma-70 family RNA polymerase sigma factor [Ruminococcaceae bacterium]|nr:sigma-70 family RNA polymerase sigma factor [Oscillospiraceae bacterium]
MCCDSVNCVELSNEELVSLINAGNNSLLQELFHRFDGTLQAKAVKYSSCADIDDLVQEGLIALFSATKVYNSSLSSFATFASVCIERAMCSIYRKTFAKKQIPDGNIVPIDEVDSISVKATPETDLIEKEECGLLAEQIKNSLSHTEYKILLSFLSGDSLESIADNFNISLKAVNNAMFRARAKIKALH